MTDNPAGMTARLIAFETVSDRSNLDLVAFIAGQLRRHGVDSRVFPNAAGDRAALLATIGPRDRPGVVLNGHLDVVPVAGQAWTSPPFSPVMRDGRLFGRGACDMKGFIGTVLALVPVLAGASLSAPIHLLFSYDEELTCLGSLDALAALLEQGPAPFACIVGEPTLMQVVDAQKSVGGYETIVTGRPAHSALPDLGANAIHAAAMIVGELAAIAAELRRLGDPSGRFDPPFSTVQVGLIEGGEALNVVPAHARLAWEARGVAGFDHDALLARVRRFSDERVLPTLRRTAPEARIETRLDILVPDLAPDPGSAAEALALRLAGRNRTEAVSYVSEAGHFQKSGIPTVLCGPGSIEQAHRADEYVALDQLDACARFLRGLAVVLSG